MAMSLLSTTVPIEPSAAASGSRPVQRIEIYWLPGVAVLDQPADAVTGAAMPTPCSGHPQVGRYAWSRWTASARLSG